MPSKRNSQDARSASNLFDDDFDTILDSPKQAQPELTDVKSAPAVEKTFLAGATAPLAKEMMKQTEKVDDITPPNYMYYAIGAVCIGAACIFIYLTVTSRCGTNEKQCQELQRKAYADALAKKCNTDFCDVETDKETCDKYNLTNMQSLVDRMIDEMGDKDSGFEWDPKKQ